MVTSPGRLLGRTSATLAAGRHPRLLRRDESGTGRGVRVTGGKFRLPRRTRRALARGARRVAHGRRGSAGRDQVAFLRPPDRHPGTRCRRRRRYAHL